MIKKKNSSTKLLSVVGIVLIIAVFTTTTWFVALISRILKAFIPIFFAFLIAFFTRPFIMGIYNKFFKSKNKGYQKATLWTYLIIFTLIFVFFKVLSAPVSYDIQEFLENITSKSFLTNLSEKIDSLFKVKSYAFLVDISLELQTWFNLHIRAILIQAANQGTTIIVKILFSFAAAIYISIDYDVIIKWFTKYVLHSNNKSKKTLEDIKIGISAWGKGWVKDQAFIFVCTLIAFWVLGISSFLMLAIVMTLFNFIPYIGPLIGGIVIWIYIIAIHVSIPGTYVLNLFYVDSEIIIIAAMILIIVIQTIESLWWIPRVYSQHVAIRPLTILISLSVIATVISPIFAPFTIPIIVIIKILYKNTKSIE